MPSTPKTSNFLTLTPLTGGLSGTAAAAFSASTEDDETTITKAGYINDLYIKKVVKDSDLAIIRYEKGTKLAFFIVKNAAKAGDPPQAQLFKFAEPASI